ncbi:MAG: hypothetical protein HY913_13895 [Desulfomonile tiedjei]|nr:hypothetical protein [Desulfomonile tiedjei]
MSKRSISVKDMIEDINKGISDAELMHRHELTHVQLQKVLGQLLKAGHVGREVLDGRRQEKNKTSSVEFEGADAPATATESRSSESPRPTPVEPHSFGLSDHASRHPGRAKSSSPSLPYSREQAARFRRNGLILIVASYACMAMFTIAGTLQAEMEYPIGNVVGLPGAIGWIVTAIVGCLWRLRGLGQNAAWAIVAPVVGLNLIVVEALPNRYEPQSYPRLLRLAFAAVGIAGWGIALSQIIRLL